MGSRGLVLEDRLERTREAFGDGHPETIRAELPLVKADLEIRKLDTAVDRSHRLLDTAIRATGPNSLLVASCLDVRAAVDEVMGRLVSAHERRERALAISDAQPQQGLEVLDRLVSLARLEVVLMKAESARERLDRALLLVEGAPIARVATPVFLERRAEVRQALGDYVGAKSDAQRALTIRDQDPTSGPIALLGPQLLLGQLAEHDGDHVASHRVAKIALRTLDGQRDRSDATTVLRMRALRLQARALASEGDEAGARRSWQQLLDHADELGPGGAGHKASILNDRAMTAILFGDPADALDDAEEALEILRRGIGKRAVPTASLAATLDTLAQAQVATGALEKARGNYEEAIALMDRGDLRHERAGQLLRYAEVLEALGRDRDAEKQRGRASAFEGAVANSRSFRSEELNVAFEAPSVEWSEYDASAQNPFALASFVRAAPFGMLMLTADANGTLVGTLEELADSVATDLRVTGEATEPLAREALTIGGVDGLLTVVDVRRNGAELSYTYWVGAAGGIAYQLIRFSERLPTDAAMGYARSDFAGFSLIDPERRLAVAGGGPIESPRYGYRVELDASWLPWAELPRIDPLADRGALHPSGVTLSLFPVVFEQRPMPPRKALAGLWSVLGNATLPSDIETLERPGGVRGERFSYLREGRRFHAQALVSRAGGVLAITSEVPDVAPDASLARSALDLVQLDPDPPPVALDGLEPSERERLSSVLLGVAQFEESRGETGAAVDTYARALAVQPDNPYLAEALAVAQIGAARYEDALATIDGIEAGRDEVPLVPAFRASALHSLGRSDEAMATYAAAVDAGLDRQDVWDAYANLALSLDRGAEVLERMAPGEPSGFSARLLRIRLLRGSGRAAEALERADALAEDHPDEDELRSERAQTLQALDRHGRPSRSATR